MREWNDDRTERKRIMSVIEVGPIGNPSVQDLCRRPYPNHRHGCPNYGKKEGCPPAAPLITETLDFTEPIYAIYNVFNFGNHVKKMRSKHPDWSQRQVECCLYWQGTARKQLREEIKDFHLVHKGNTIVMCPEAQGVDVTATMKEVGIILEWPPKNKAYQIVLAGTASDEEG